MPGSARGNGPLWSGPGAVRAFIRPRAAGWGERSGVHPPWPAAVVRLNGTAAITCGLAEG